MASQSTVLNRCALTGAAVDARHAIAALAARVEAEGERGVTSCRFHVDETAGAARAVIDYATPAAWIGHRRIAMDWPEMKGLHGVARLEEVVFLGRMTDAIADWLAGSPLTARVIAGCGEAAGFVRQGQQDG